MKEGKQEATTESPLIKEFKAPVNYVQTGKDVTTVSYTADKTAEMGHPDANGKLSEAINGVLKDEGVSTLKEFHTKLYESLWQESQFKNTKYSFKYKITYNSNLVEIGESDNLLFWLLASSHSGEVCSILSKYKFDLETVRDNNDNNILHIAALYGDSGVISAIVKSFSQFENLINHRNNDGTNPLGMAFLNELVPEKLIETVKLFVEQKSFKVNDYLNNKKGMDVLSNGFLKQIGGFNILHVALAKGYRQILESLYERQEQSQSDTDSYYVNFKYPALNPAHHMNSPKKILESGTGASKETKYLCKNLLEQYQSKQTQKEDENSSGDSENEDSSAYVWKHVLIDMMKAAEITKNTETHVVPLFHGVPLMSGLYTHSDRKYVGKKLMLLNHGLTEKTKSVIKKQLGEDENIYDELKSVHSRSSTASVGMENLAKIFKCNDSVLNELHKIDAVLKNGLQKVFNEDKGAFQTQVVKFVNEFSSDKAHKQVWSSLTKINKELNDCSIVKYRFPFISTSKTADHAVKYGFGTNLELPRGEGKLEPQYEKGNPKHRLAGFLYVIKEDAEKFAEKLEVGEIFDICTLDGVNALFKKQIEIAYLGGISKENILAVIPLIYPSFPRHFDEAYHDKTLSFSKKTYKQAKIHFCTPQLTEDKSLILTQQTETHKGQLNTLGACLANIFVHLAEKITFKFSDGALVSFLDKGFVKYTLGQNYTLTSSDFTSPNHKMLSKSLSTISFSPEPVDIKSKAQKKLDLDSVVEEESLDLTIRPIKDMGLIVIGSTEVNEEEVISENSFD